LTFGPALWYISLVVYCIRETVGMNVPYTGELNPKKFAALFAALFAARASGVIYFRGPDGRNAFVTLARGRAEHASGEAGEGESAVRLMATWPAGDYRFMEDIRPDAGTFPVNLGRGFADALARGELAPAPPDEEAGPPFPIIVLGEPVAIPGGADAAGWDAALSRAAFTGCWAIGPPERRRGFVLYMNGAVGGAIAREGRLVLRGDEARGLLWDAARRPGVNAAALAVKPEEAAALKAALTARPAVARIPAVAVNVDEYIAWLEASKQAALISVVAGAQVANILVAAGKRLGAVVAPDSRLKAEVDDALTLFYSAEATVEIFVGSGA